MTVSSGNSRNSCQGDVQEQPGCGGPPPVAPGSSLPLGGWAPSKCGKGLEVVCFACMKFVSGFWPCEVALSEHAKSIGGDIPGTTKIRWRPLLVFDIRLKVFFWGGPAMGGIHLFKLDVRLVL